MMNQENNLEYLLSLALAKLLLKKGIITTKEFEELDQLNRSSFFVK